MDTFFVGECGSKVTQLTNNAPLYMLTILARPGLELTMTKSPNTKNLCLLDLIAKIIDKNTNFFLMCLCFHFFSLFVGVSENLTLIFVKNL